jgi:hypothetical protein
MHRFVFLIFLGFVSSLDAQDNSREIQFPDVEGYKTLKCDFHIHTVFSDGLVWPTIRVDEAVKDGLDAIALTEHIEYQPWKDDIPHPDRNRSYEIARKAAVAHDLLVIHGTEITRKMPPGHANALFVTDVNALMIEDSVEVYKEAIKQGAFIFWNHPNWINQEKDGIPQLSDLHKFYIEKRLLHGIEVVNDITFSEEALKIAVENGLTVMGTSDIHGLVDYQFDIANGGHRPITLVFAEEKSETAIKEALFAGRTVTWFNEVLAGKKEQLNLLMNATLIFKNLGYIGDSDVMEVEITNRSDARLFLNNISPYDFYRNNDLIEVLPQSCITINVLTKRDDILKTPLRFEIMNAIYDYKKNLEVDHWLSR